MLVDLANRHDRRRITLMYSNLNKEDIAFAQDLTDLNLSGFKLIHVLQQSRISPQTYQGVITSKIIRSEMTADLQSSTFLLSGPPRMVNAMEEQLALLGIDADQIRADRFLGYP